MFNNLSPAASVPSTAKVHMNTTVNARDKCIIQQTRHQTSIEANCNRCVTTEVQQLRPVHVQGGKFDSLCQQQCGDGCVRGLDEEAVRTTEELRQTGRKSVFQTEFIRQVNGIHWVLLDIHCGINILKQHFKFNI